jgi:hypothetical protein
MQSLNINHMLNAIESLKLQQFQTANTQSVRSGRFFLNGNIDIRIYFKRFNIKKCVFYFVSLSC